MRTATYIYGAGGMGREVLAHLRASGHPVEAFIDRAAGRIGPVDGIPVVALDAIPHPADCRIEVALHSPGVDIAQVVADLRSRGCDDVSTLWATCRRDAWLPAMHFWLDPGFSWASVRADVAKARALMQDDCSRRVFDEQVRLRESGDYAALGAPTPKDQYVPTDLPRWSDPMRLVDCGAYDGDTLKVFAAAGYTLDGAIALEPDPSNYARLVKSVAGRAALRTIKAGVHSTSGTLTFAADGAGSAHVDDAGTIRIDVVSLDAICGDWRPTLIKMDIEGAERDALEGARATLAACRPALAISAYHRIDDLWWLPLWIDALGLGYRFDLRSHAHNGFDTVLYARAYA